MDRKKLEEPFSKEQIKQRKGNFGKMLDYIEAHAIIQRLNDVFDSKWNFEILKSKVLEDEVLVLGKLVAENVVKFQYGGNKITRNTDSKEIICISDDFKAAATDSLKKCASLLGVGLHLYSKETTKPQKQQEPKKPDTLSASNLQIKSIVSLASQNNISNKDLLEMIKKRFNKSSLEVLTQEEAKQVATGLKNNLSKPKAA